MNVPQQNKITAIIGSKGCGKTTYAKSMYRDAPRAIAVDSQREYTEGFCVSSWDQFVEHVHLQKKRFHVVFMPLELDDLEFCCRVARAKKNLLLLVDEIHLYCSANRTPEELKRLFLLARHSGVDIVYTAQRIQDISRVVTSQTDEFILFRVSEPVDLKGLRERFDSETVERVRRLPDHEFIVVNVRDRGRKNALSSVDTVRAGGGVRSDELRAENH